MNFIETLTIKNLFGNKEITLVHIIFLVITSIKDDKTISFLG